MDASRGAPGQPGAVNANDPDTVRRSYDAVAEDYAANIGDELGGKPLDRWLLERVVAFADGGPILDAGCGPGHVAGFLASAAPTASVHGFDLSPVMVALAQHRVPEASFRVGDLFDPPSHGDGGGWAAIVAFYSIVHLDADELPEVFTALRSRVRPGGRLLVACHCGDDRIHLDEWWGHDVTLDFVFHEREAVIGALTLAGLQVDEVIVRSPYAGVEHPSQRLYLLASAPG